MSVAWCIRSPFLSSSSPSFTTPSFGSSFEPDIFRRFATKKAAGTSKNGRDSAGRRLGPKKNHLEAVTVGNIIVRQRGTVYRPGLNVTLGKDHTISSLIDGRVFFTYNAERKRAVVNVLSHEAIAEAKQQVQSTFQPHFLNKPTPAAFEKLQQSIIAHHEKHNETLKQ
eukprot:TRINITY_DN9269_c0_g1_i1.p1 TRINITY_DN9269_c0_g1~~TRINITY_DN9269_c0_g1_i1.p1  ORF type:complete len:168 (-),score=42.72 TRINITY_DN9269_c0_g1_i1:62-565(-)